MTKVDIFSGFLGAGKTTLIKKLIDEAYEDEKIVIIEEELLITLIIIKIIIFKLIVFPHYYVECQISNTIWIITERDCLDNYQLSIAIININIYFNILCFMLILLIYNSYYNIIIVE